MNRRVLCAALCLAIFVTLTACTQDGMSKVTVYFGENLDARAVKKPGILDRMRSFILPSAYAAGAPWTSSYDSVTMTITGEDMDPLIIAIPPNAFSYTVEVPSGDERLFTITAYNGSVKKWGGHALYDLNESEASINLNVYPIVTDLYVSWFGQGVQMTWSLVNSTSVYYVYRSTSPLGPYIRVATISGGSHDHNDGYPPNGVYYYKVSVSYPTGEGEPCDAQMVVVN